MTTEVQWSRLLEWYNGDDSVYLRKSDTIKPGVRVVERFNEKIVYDYTRYFDNTRETHSDLCGLVGLSLCDFSNKTIFLTEGVSDFLTVKHFLPECNVVGRTRPSFSRKQVSVLNALFDNVNLIIDNDDTGRRIAASLIKVLNNVKLIKPDYPYKDITEQFLDCVEQEDINYVINRLQA
jgi:5S rRNA maturation endonuclease (ribonuclease M5)